MNEAQKGFEAWLESEFGMWAIPVNGKYKSRQTQAMWEAWQAALQSQTAPQPDHFVGVNKMGEVLRRAWYHADEDGDYNIYDALNAECPDCIEVLIVKPNHSPDAGKVVQDFVNGQEPLEQDFAAIYNENTSTLYEYDSPATDGGKVVQGASYGLHHVSRMYQVMRKHDSTIDDVALDSMRDVLREVLAGQNPTTAAESREEIQAQALEKFADWLKRQSFAHNKRWTSAANEALRCAKRLRASQQEGGEGHE